MTLRDLQQDLNLVADQKRAAFLNLYFRTQEPHRDVFIGVKVPDQQRVAKKYTDLGLADLEKLVTSKIHEHRLTALIILKYKFAKANNERKREICDLYLKNIKSVDNWDLVDSSAHFILGEYLKDKDRSLLYELANSNNIWERRVAIIACFAFIRDKDFKDALAIAHTLLQDKEDLIQKAVGWMIREIGNKDLYIEEEFLKSRYKQMPRTMLRYAIEKFEETKRRAYLEGKI